LASGIGTDRFIVDWRIAGERGDWAAREAGQVDTGGGGEGAIVSLKSLSAPLPATPRVRVEVPASIQDVKAERPDEAAAWRAVTRRAFEHYLAAGYRVTAFHRDAETGRCFYGLEQGTGD
jgi:predicted GNAT superfamily acetyltransferase